MKHFKEVQTFQVMSVTCDVCNCDCTKSFSTECANISADWGYESDNDGDNYDFDLCESCFLKMVDHLKTFAVNPDRLNPKSILPEE